MKKLEEIIDRALTIPREHEAGDMLEKLRRGWGRSVPELLAERLDQVQEAYLGLPDGQVLEALGQELSALGWDLYDLEAGEGHRLVLVPGAESLAFARDIRQETGYCRRMGQPGRDRGRPARRLSPERWLPREEYALSGSTRYVMDAIAGDFGCGRWMERDAGDWQGSCVFDLRELPPRIVRLGRKKRFTRLTYSPRQECYAAVYAPSTAAIWTVAAGLDPLCADDWSRPMDLTFDTCPRRIWWLGKYLCAGDREKAACAWVRGGTARESHRLRLPEGEVPRRFAVDGLDRLYLADGTEGGPVYRWEDGRAVPLPFALEDGEDLGESVPVPGTGHLWLLRRTHGTELLDLDMETGARRVRPLDGVEPEAALRPLWGDWAALVNGPHGEGETAAWFWNRRTGEELRLIRSMLGGARLDQLGALTDGTVVFTALRPDGEQVLCRPTAFWAHLRKAAGGESGGRWSAPGGEPGGRVRLDRGGLTVDGRRLRPPFGLERACEALGEVRLAEDGRCVWDARGIQGRLDGEKKRLLTLEFCLEPHPENLPRQLFGGALRLGEKDLGAVKWTREGEADTARVGGFTVRTRRPGPFPAEADRAARDRLALLASRLEVSWEAPRPKPRKAAPPEPYRLRRAEGPVLHFDHLNFKLAVVQVLMYEKELLGPKFDIWEFTKGCMCRTLGLEEEDAGPLPEVLRWFERLPVPAGLAGAVTELHMDGEDRIYSQIWPGWDGDDECFDLNGVTEAELRQFPALERMTVMTSRPEAVLPVLEQCGIEAELW